jgi:hypothetical protein
LFIFFIQIISYFVSTINASLLVINTWCNFRNLYRNPLWATTRGSEVELSSVTPVFTCTFLTPSSLSGTSSRRRKTRDSSDDFDDLPLDNFINEDLRAGGPYLCSIPTRKNE